MLAKTQYMEGKVTLVTSTVIILEINQALKKSTKKNY